MTTKEMLEITFLIQVGLCVAVLGTMLHRRVLRIFPHVGMILGWMALWQVGETVCMFHRKAVHLNKDQAWQIFFWGSMVSDAVILTLQVLTIYSVFAEAMRPMAGLHKAGKLVFRWVGAVSSLVALSLIAGPELFTGGASFAMVISHLHQGISVLTLCLLVFVCFATRPLGLTFRSHIFGVSLGLGLFATIDLIQAAWLITKGAGSIYSPVHLFGAIGFCCAVLVWGIYFALPEPERKMILLPTTSPFFFWNRISEILGDAPGNVAVAGFSPSMLAPAEVEMLTAATSREAAAAGAAEPSTSEAASTKGVPTATVHLPVRSGLPLRRKTNLALSR